MCFLPNQMWGLSGQAKLIEPVMTHAMASMLCEGARMAGDVWDGLGGTRMNLVGAEGSGGDGCGVGGGGNGAPGDDAAGGDDGGG